MVHLRKIALERRRLDLVDRQDRQHERVLPQRIAVLADDDSAIAFDALQQVGRNPRRAGSQPAQNRGSLLSVARPAFCGGAFQNRFSAMYYSSPFKRAGIYIP
jgi:hypothetical protein